MLIQPIRCHEKGEAVANRLDCQLLTMLSNVSVMDQDVQMKKRQESESQVEEIRVVVVRV